jgi:23S rRNA (adenine2503-C2)-methyltransferase
MNLIPYNEVDELDFRRPSWEHAADMARRLHRRGILTKLRHSAGQDVDGGCGQLRARESARPAHRKPVPIPLVSAASLQAMSAAAEGARERR